VLRQRRVYRFVLSPAPICLFARVPRRSVPIRDARDMKVGALRERRRMGRQRRCEGGG